MMNLFNLTKKIRHVINTACLLCIISSKIAAQTDNTYTSKLYFAWGYNHEWYTHSTIAVSQPNLNSQYQFNNITGNDHIGWDKLFARPLTIPQYNYRIGYFFKRHPTWGVEFNFDHTKYQMTIGQTAHITGTVNGAKVDTNMVIVDTYMHWKLNNGANFFLFNLTKRFFICGTTNNKLKLFNLYKIGFGPVIPHTENTLWGYKNNAGFQFGGYNIGFEAAYRLEIYNYVFLDIAQKLDYARYFGLHVYNGTSSQHFGCYELIATLGFTLH